jgi:quercetin dioxygenase-like cupin family protein
MKKSTYLMMSVLLAVLALAFTAHTAVAAEEWKTVADGNVKVLLDNDRVRVLERVRHPGTKVPMHTHPPYLAYFFAPWKGRFTSADGKVSEKAFPAGKLLWSPKGKTHAIEIIGTTDQHVLVIEIKK